MNDNINTAGDISHLLREGERVTPINDGLRLIERQGGLGFGTDALLLAAFLPARCGRAAEFGTGSGGASLLAAWRGKTAHIDALEISEREADIAFRNVEINGLGDRIEVIRTDLRDYASVPQRSSSLDTVFSNPPYMQPGHGFPSSDRGRDDARRENNGTIFDFAAAASSVLRTGGCFYAVYLPSRLADLISALRAADLEPKKLTPVSRDIAHKPSMILVSAKKGASPSLEMTKTFYINNPLGEPSDEYTEVLGGGMMP